MWVPGQVGSKQEAGVSRLAPGTLAGVGQAVLTGQPLAAEWGAFLWVLQSASAPASPAARCISFAVGALMPLTEGVLGAGMTVTMLLTEWTEGRHQHQQGLAAPIILTVGPALTQVTGGTVEAPATALISQAAQTGGVGGAGRRAVGLQEEEGDLLGQARRTGVRSWGRVHWR